ncbi:MAG: acyltransferase family protein [Paludibacteraceae bacterium]|nr:acyltransferase family protein [Paludibacteraceae bacterium]
MEFNAPIQERNAYWDCVKFFMILLVVVGHSLSFGIENSRMGLSLFNLIYCFHMPVFVFVSGRFCNKAGSRFLKSCFKVLETYLLFQIIFTLYEYPGEFGSQFFFPRVAMWYLLSLFFWRMFILFIPKKLESKPTLLICLAVIGALFSVFVPISTMFSFQRTFFFFPFFLLGYLTKNVDFQFLWNRSLNKKLCVAFLVVLWGGLYAVDDKIYMYYSGLMMGGVKIMLCRIICLISSAFIGLLVLKLIPVSDFAASVGKRTLYIYIYHIIVVLYLGRYLCGIGLLPTSLIPLLLYSIVSFSLLIVLSKFRFLNVLLNPFSSLCDYVLSEKERR